MAIYFNPDKYGFYNTDSGVPVPEGSILVDQDQYLKFIHEMNNNNKKLVLVKGKLVLKNFVSKTTWDIVRGKRNRLLRQSDYSQLPDYPGDSEAWAKYRQELRDITTQKDPNEIVWPTKPHK
jgi:hypothetical protein